MSDETVDPGDLDLKTEDARKDGRKRFKKLAKGAPGDIRMLNKQGIGSQGTRAVLFRDYDTPLGLDEEEEADFAQEVVEQATYDFEVEDVPKDALAACAEYSAAEQLNIYFAHRANRTLAEIHPSPGQLLCFIDVFLTGDELQDFEDAADELNRLLAAKKMEREEARNKAAEAEQAKAEQDAADLELGRKCREHNLIEKAREAEEKLRAIRKAANRLAQKHGEKGWEDDAAS